MDPYEDARLKALAEAMEIWKENLKERAKIQYRGKQELQYILEKVDSGDAIIGSEVEILVEDPETETFHTEKRTINVLDDLGYPMAGLEDLGGKCFKGEVAHKDHFHQCLECQRPFCDLHVKFVDNDPEKPLCCYEPNDKGGCYYHHHYKFKDKLRKKRAKHERNWEKGEWIIERLKQKKERVQLEKI